MTFIADHSASSKKVPLWQAIARRFGARTLARDLAWGLAFICTILLAAAALIYYAMVMIQTSEALDRQANLTADEVAEVLSAPLWTLDTTALRQISAAYCRAENVAGLVVRDDTGQILFQQPPTESQVRLYARAIYHEGRMIGQLELAFSRQSFEVQRQRVLWESSLAILLVIASILGASNLLLRRYLGQPLRQLTVGIDHIALGRYHEVLAPVPQADLNLLISKINAMAQQIAERDTALRQQEEQFRQVVTSITDYVYLTELTASGRFINRYASPNIKQLMGYAPEKLMNDWNFWLEQAIFPADRPKAEAQIRRLAAGQDSETEYRLLDGHGRLLWVRDSARVETSGDSRFIYGVMSDITQRKRAEQVQVALYQIPEAALFAENLDQFYGALHAIIGELMPTRNFYIALYHAATDLLHFVYHVDERETNWDPQPPGKSLTGYVLRTGRSLLATPEVFEQMVQAGQVEAIGVPSEDWLGVPLNTQHATLGVVVVQTYSETTRLGEAERDILTFASTQMALAIERKEAEEALRLDDARLDALARLNEMSEASEEAITHFALAEAVGLTKSAVGYVGFVGNAETTLTLYAWPLSVEVRTESPHSFSTIPAGPWTEVLRQRRATISNQPPTFLSAEALQTHLPISRYLSVPVFEGQDIVVVVGVGNKPEPYDETDVRQLTLLMQDMWRILQRQRAVAEIRQLNTDLERRVQERTTQLDDANRELLTVNRELNATNVQLAHALRSRDEFLASMSHELRTPLTGILGLSEALQMGIYGPLLEKQGQMVDMIGASGRHLLALITDILDLAKTTAGKLELALAPVNVAQVCQASLQMVKGQANQKQLSVALELDPAVTIIKADERRLKQILVNLLGNAVKFTPPGGKIGLTVAGEAAQGVARFLVWDTGIGIAPEVASRLFKPFVQLDNRLNREHSGTGLGLALTRELVALHGGSIGLESTGIPGQGSRFTLSLPWRVQKGGTAPLRARDADDASQMAPRQPAEGRQLLVADDNAITRSVLCDGLTAQGYRVVVARDGAEALAKAQAAPPALMILDIQMPGLDGLEVIRRVRSATALSAIPIIALTALVMPGDKERCLEAGANEYLGKPVVLKTLLGLVEALLQQAEAG